ncbi:hypothetical protein AAVH_31498 [Aphelenchoides avenae]|nr:hypothetical protein AAVH_31498 [Aphelenchus avenae]
MTPGTGVSGGSSTQQGVATTGGQRPAVGSGFGAQQRRVNASQFMGSPNSSSGGAAGGGQPPPPQLQPQFPSGSGN